MTALSPYRRVRANPIDWFDAKEIERGRAYVGPMRRMGYVQSVFTTAVAIAFVVGDVGPRLIDKVDVSGWWLQLVAVLVAFMAGDLIVSTWFDQWRELVWEKRWNMSTQTVGGFVTDTIKNAAVGVVTVLLLLTPLWILIRTTDLWWLFGWLVFAGFTGLVGTLYPVLVAPLFNRYTPMPAGELRTRLLDVARTADLDVGEVLVADASRRSRAINAHVAGLGKTRRVVVFDTLLDWPPEYLEQIVGHELGHWRHRHILRKIPVIVASQGIGLVLAAVAFEWDWLLETAGLTSIEQPAALPLFLVVFQVGFMLTTLIISWLSRADERAADIYALDLLRDPDAFSGAFRMLVDVNKADVDPPLWKRITHTHPPLAERLAMASAWTTAESGSSPADAPATHPAS